MIIDRKHQFAFVHIPKCAGTAVRQSLQQFDSYAGQFTDRVADHIDLGMLDHVHIPLFVLRDHFPQQFQEICDYWSVAIVRDPFARFASSVSQHFKMYSEVPIRLRTPEEVRTVVDECINHLSGQPLGQHRLSAEYIHFQRQVDYVYLDGEKVVCKLYSVEDVPILLDEVGARIGHRLEAAVTDKQANRTVVFRNGILGNILEAVRPVTNQVSKLLPERTKQKIRKRIYVPRDERLKTVFEAENIQDFVRTYYAEDIALFNRIAHARVGEAI